MVDGAEVDIGLVGDIVHVDPDTVRGLLERGHIPVISPIARGAHDDNVYNINADLAAAALAEALDAEKLVMLTDVAGLYADWPHSTEIIDRLTAGELAELLPSMTGGMVPKMEGCLRAVRSGVRMAHVLDGRVPHTLVLEVFADEHTGTTVVPDGPPDEEHLPREPGSTSPAEPGRADLPGPPPPHPGAATAPGSSAYPTPLATSRVGAIRDSHGPNLTASGPSEMLGQPYLTTWGRTEEGWACPHRTRAPHPGTPSRTSGTWWASASGRPTSPWR